MRLDSIGDYILFRNFIQVIKESEQYKDAELILCGNIWWKDIAEQYDAKYISEFIWIDYNRLNQFFYRWKSIFKIRKQKCNVLIHPTYSRSGMTDRIVKHCGATERIGYSGEAEVRALKSAEWVGGHIMPQGDALLSGYYLNELLMPAFAVP